MWTYQDEQMLGSIETELLTLIDAYEFIYDDPNATREKIEEAQKEVRFKNKQIEWLLELKNRIKENEI